MSFVDDFQANLEALPSILQRKYALLRDLDKSLQEIQRQNEHRCDQEIEEMKQRIKSGNVTPDSLHIKFSDEAVDEQRHAVRIADEKVALAVQAYDLVDTHIQQLDQYLRKLEEIRHEKENASTAGSPAPTDSNAKSRRSGEGGRGGRKKATRVPATATTAAPAATTSANPSGMDLDIPVDPNEPTYCICNQVSYGEMIACDNPGCKIEWFHYGCVGLREPPKGNWYCPDCVGTRRRKGK